jgi:hypothetical protein
MDIYKFKKLENGDILLKKVTISNINYILENQENGNILLRKIISVDIKNINDIKNYDFAKSKILECMINNKIFNKFKYKSVLEEICKIIDDGTKIIKNTKLNIKTVKKEDEGFYYLDFIGISIQGVDSNKCLLEIINQCIENKIKISMKIKLFNQDNINLSF